jgi:hypothetical protein
MDLEHVRCSTTVTEGINTERAEMYYKSNKK